MIRMGAAATRLSLTILVGTLALTPATAAQRARSRDSSSSDGGGSTGRVAVPRTPAGSSGRSSAAPRAARPSSRTDRTRNRDTRTSDDDSARAPSYGRPRGDKAAVGAATERRSIPPGNGSTIVVPGRRPYYHEGFYPWGYGGFGLGAYWDGYYEPWYPYYPTADIVGWDGRLRLKVKPVEAEVFVDGYYAGRVDDFDGLFQRLHVETGPHRIEIREEGYEPLIFDVRVLPDRTITYEGELKPLLP